MQYFNDPIFAAVTNPGSGNVLSAAIDSRFYVNATVQAKFSDAAAAGTLKLQGSNDSSSPANWNDIPSATATVASGALSTTPILSTPICYQWVRVVFASTGGGGTITANLHMNGY